jgi:hypothetical protein
MRDAILNQNLKTSQGEPNRWTWLWAPIAAGVLVFTFLNNRQVQTSPIVIQSGPSVADNFKPITEVSPWGSDILKENETPIATVTQTQPSTAGMTAKQKRPITRHFTRNNPKTPIVFVNAKVQEPSRAKLSVSRGSDPDKKASIIAEASSDPIILVHTDTDDTTGTQSATEVESVANVVIGG